MTIGPQSPRPPGIRAGILGALPITLGYFPIAFSFGVAATRAGLTGAEAVMLSVVIYAGAAQFLALALVTSGAPMIVAAFSLIAMNIRHVLYGPSLLKRAGRDASTKLAAVWAFGLTDEVFGTALGALARGQRFSEAYMLGLGATAYLSWILGTAFGAWAGGGALSAYPALEAGLGFMLPALFLSLLLSILGRAQVPVIVVASLCTIVFTLLISSTWGIMAGMVTGAVVGVLRRGTS